MPMKKISALLATVLLVVFAAAGPAQAVALSSPIGNPSIPTLIGRVIGAALGVAGVAALLMFIYGGYLWLISGGNPETIKKGKGTLVWAVIGLVVIFTAFVAVNFVIQVLTTETPAEGT